MISECSQVRDHHVVINCTSANMHVSCLLQYTNRHIIIMALTALSVDGAVLNQLPPLRMHAMI